MQNANLTNVNSTIDRILEHAVVLNWKDLTLNCAPEAMQLEYRIDTTRSLEYLKLWSSMSRGHWELVCEYWMHSSQSHPQGIKFANAYASAGLTAMLDAIMHHQQAFTVPSGKFVEGLVQIAPPDETQSNVAGSNMTETLERIGPQNLPWGMTTAVDHPPDLRPTQQ